MSGFPTKLFLSTLILSGLVLPAGAQNAGEAQTSLPARSASFLPEGSASGAPDPAFSGLASAPELVPPPAALISSPPPSLGSSAPTSQPAIAIGTPPSVPLGSATQSQAVSEALPNPSADYFGMLAWKGASAPVIARSLNLSSVTLSPLLNQLMRRLLIAATTAPEGSDDTVPGLVALRALKLAELGDAAAGWALASHADPKIFDDASFHTIAEDALANGDEAFCAQLPDFSKARPSVDWQRAVIVCQLRAKDLKAAQVSLDVLRTQVTRDAMFLEVADRNVIGDSKTLPRQLTPLTPPMLALLSLAGQPLPGELYGHPDSALIPALLRLPSQQDVAQLGLGERAAERGMISPEFLESLYQSVVFSPDELQNPLAASATGSRLRALMYRAALSEKDDKQKIVFAVKFLASSPPELLAGVGRILADMIGSVKPSSALANNAISVAQIYMLAGQGSDALEWLRSARASAGDKIFQSDDFRVLWPQFALAGLESEAEFQADLDHWLDATLKAPDGQTTDMHVPRDIATAAVLLLEAVGFKVADSSWSKILALPRVDKHLAMSTLIAERLRSASVAGARGETILLSLDLAGEGEISFPSVVEIARALRLIGLKNEAADFARQNLAIVSKPN